MLTSTEKAGTDASSTSRTLQYVVNYFNDVADTLDVEKILESWSVGLLSAALTGLSILFINYAHNLYLRHKHPVKGQFITHYEDIINGEKVSVPSFSSFSQRGATVRGFTRLSTGRCWRLRGKIDEGYLYGTYVAESPYDTGRGTFFLQVVDRDLEGIWCGYDHVNREVTYGSYIFRRIPRIKIKPIDKKMHAEVLDLADRVLMPEYLGPSKDVFNFDNSVFLCATSRKVLVGFVLARGLENGELVKILKNNANINIPLDVKYADEQGNLGIIQTVAVRPEFQGRGIASKLLERSEKMLLDIGAQTIICPAWHSRDGVHLAGVLDRMQYISWADIEKFWKEESINKNYQCLKCGNPCVCSVRFYKKSKF